MSRTGRAAVVASPLLVGAVTVLITVVAVFLAYNANQGLPFVPTYDIKAELPSAGKLIEGNAVRIGGNRVGQVTGVDAKTIERDGEPATVAVLELALDKDFEPLPVDTVVTVRPRSLLGLKFVELIPGDAKEGFEAGATIPIENARSPVEFEDVLSTFDAETRVAARGALEGYGNAFAGRGDDLNIALRELRPFFLHLTPVMETLSDPDTQLDQFFRQIGEAASQAAPVAQVQAQLFTNMAETFEAFSRNEAALAATIDLSPETMLTAISSFRVQRPFLADFTALSRELEPASAELRRSLPEFNEALVVGAPVLAGVPRTNELAADVLRELEELAENPATLLALQNLDRTVEVSAPLVEFVAPYQTVCNYFNYFFTPLGGHLSEPVQDGTIERVLVVEANPEQDDGVSHSDADRMADVPADEDPQKASNLFGPLTKLNTQFYGPAIDPNGKADCQAGQTGYPDGPLITTGRYPPDTEDDGEFKNGGSHVVMDPDLPLRVGGTYKSRELGIDGLEDVR